MVILSPLHFSTNFRPNVLFIHGYNRLLAETFCLKQHLYCSTDSRGQESAPSFPVLQQQSWQLLPGLGPHLKA